jgi:hypothetical protein
VQSPRPHNEGIPGMGISSLLPGCQGQGICFSAAEGKGVSHMGPSKGELAGKGGMIGIITLTQGLAVLKPQERQYDEKYACPVI